MKTIIYMLLLSAILLMVACNRDKSLQKTSISNSINTKSTTNFLVNNSYFTELKQDINGKLSREMWHPVSRLLNTKEPFYYGIYIQFTDSLHYRKYNAASCGNDCFFTTVGKYCLTDMDKLIMTMDSVQFERECGNMETIYGDGSVQIYQITINLADSTLELIPLNEYAKGISGYY